MFEKDMSAMNIGECGEIISIKHSNAMQRRLYELGLIPGTNVSCIMHSCGRDMLAYNIRGAVLALRQVDSKKITVRIF